MLYFHPCHNTNLVSQAPDSAFRRFPRDCYVMEVKLLLFPLTNPFVCSIKPARVTAIRRELVYWFAGLPQIADGGDSP